VAAGGDDGRGQEEHGAEQHDLERIQVGDGRHCSSGSSIGLVYVRTWSSVGRRRRRGILECRKYVSV